MDPLTASLSTFGVILLLCSWIQLLIVSFKEDFTWGLTSLFLPPISYLYSLTVLDKAAPVIGLAAIGGGLIFLAVI